MPNYAVTVLENVTVALAAVSPGSATRIMPWGSPGNGIYIGRWPNKIRLSQRFEEFVYQPSGIRFQRRQQMQGAFKITLEGVHVFEDGAVFDVLRNRLGFLELTAWAADYSAWKRWYFYGVTCAEMDFFDAEVEMNESKTFDAWFAANDSGVGDSPPDPKLIDGINLPVG